MNYDLQPPLCRASDPLTSYESADRVKEFKEDHLTLILDVLRRNHNHVLGAEQIALATGLDAYQIRKRLPELAKNSLVQVYPQTRSTSTGRRERIWGIA